MVELMDWLRRKAKYENVREIAIEEVRAKIAEFLAEHSITTIQ